MHGQVHSHPRQPSAAPGDPGGGTAGQGPGPAGQGRHRPGPLQPPLHDAPAHHRGGGKGPPGLADQPGPDPGRPRVPPRPVREALQGQRPPGRPRRRPDGGAGQQAGALLRRQRLHRAGRRGPAGGAHVGQLPRAGGAFRGDAGGSAPQRGGGVPPLLRGPGEARHGPDPHGNPEQPPEPHGPGVHPLGAGGRGAVRPGTGPAGGVRRDLRVLRLRLQPTPEPGVAAGDVGAHHNQLHHSPRPTPCPAGAWGAW